MRPTRPMRTGRLKSAHRTAITGSDNRAQANDCCRNLRDSGACRWLHGMKARTSASAGVFAFGTSRLAKGDGAVVLHRDIYWLGRQWAVTGYGVQAVDKKLNMKFDIEA